MASLHSKCLNTTQPHQQFCLPLFSSFLKKTFQSFYFLSIYCKTYGELHSDNTKRKVGGGGGWVATEVLLLLKGGWQKVLAMLKGGTKSLEIVYTRELGVLAIQKGVYKITPFKRHASAKCLDAPV